MKGLLLNETYGMWDAAITGKKTNTRRAHKSLEQVNSNPDEYEFIGSYRAHDDFGTTYARFKPKSGGQIIQARARYDIDEITFLQEPTLNLCPHVTDKETIMYRYPDHNGHNEMQAFKQLIEAAQAKGAEWGNKMFMPEERARYFVKIKRIAVERIHDISEADCLAEGIELKLPNSNPKGYAYSIKDGMGGSRLVLFDTPKKAYLALYRAVTPKKEFIENPWVFSYHFELCSKP